MNMIHNTANIPTTILTPFSKYFIPCAMRLTFCTLVNGLRSGSNATRRLTHSIKTANMNIRVTHFVRLNYISV
ncbi:hypothetical protein SEA_EFFIE_740 [Acinetobacter phage Effie]|nr:hypothetical protein SEA_EFFIE_740 [Acinetobacter phage Effie]